MPRLLGVDIPNDKMTAVSLTYLYGVGPATARELCQKAGISPGLKARDLTEDELGRLSQLLRHSAPAELAGPRPADTDQRPDSQGPEEDGGRQEGRQGSPLIPLNGFPLSGSKFQERTSSGQG